MSLAEKRLICVKGGEIPPSFFQRNKKLLVWVVMTT
jgi:hypothetical protein